MSGFEIYNESGAVMVNSDHKHTVIHSIYNPAVGGTGDYNLSTPFGNISQLGYLLEGQGKQDGYLHWIQFLSNGAWGFPSSDMFLPGSIRVMRTTRNANHQSGYLDVFDASGQLIWSAASASTMPRITGFLEIPGGYPLESQVASVSPGYNPFFLWEACMGEMSTDGVVSGYSGNLMRWTGSELQTFWIRRNQRGFNDIFNGRGNMKIPLAKFIGYN